MMYSFFHMKTFLCLWKQCGKVIFETTLDWHRKSLSDFHRYHVVLYKTLKSRSTELWGLLLRSFFFAMLMPDSMSMCLFSSMHWENNFFWQLLSKSIYELADRGPCFYLSVAFCRNTGLYKKYKGACFRSGRGQLIKRCLTSALIRSGFAQFQKHGL